MISVFVPAPRALGRVWRGPPAESPSRRGQRVTQVDRTARAAAERQVRSSRMPHAGYADSVTNDRPEFHSDIAGKISMNFTNPHFTFPVHEHSFIHSHTSKHRICNYCITTLHVATRSDSRLIQHERQPTRVQRPAHVGLEATSCQTELGEKTRMSPSGLCLTHSEADRVISTFLFDPNLEPCP